MRAPRRTLSSRSVVATVAAAAALGAATTEVPSAVRAGLEALREPARSGVGRELAPADALDVPPEALVRAAEVIPPHATYNVVVGDQLDPTDTQRIGIPDLFRYWLLPRRRIEGLDHADWVITYGQSTETLDASPRREVALAPSINAVELDHR